MKSRVNTGSGNVWNENKECNYNNIEFNFMKTSVNFETSMSKQGHKARANLPAGGFLAIGRDVPSTSEVSRTKPQVHKRELPQLSSGVLKKPRLDFSGKILTSTPSTSSVKRAGVDDSRWRSFCAEVGVFTKFHTNIKIIVQ
ncbi:unnamed protein product [Onchocerca flexuosa]|uniref:Uncharacterized protein n=1 Tax=Onchocerca flexuosa TaxID=387005 RepID=A0A183HL96_9BILA|nr:unnamed protein product [Onchocerca flexuosa]